ncbi:protein mab-21-like 2 [Glandiceps talaboti]
MATPPDSTSTDASTEERNEKLNYYVNAAIKQFALPRFDAIKRNSEVVLRTVESITEKLKDIDPRLMDCFGSYLGRVSTEYLVTGTNTNQFEYRLAFDLPQRDQSFQVTTFARDMTLPDQSATVKVTDVDMLEDGGKLSSWQDFVDVKGYLLGSKVNTLLHEAIDNTLMIYGDELEMVTISESVPLVNLKIKEGEYEVFVKIVPCLKCFGLPPGARLPPKWPNHPYAKGKSKRFMKEIHAEIHAGASMWVFEGRQYVLPQGIVKPPSAELVPRLWSISMDIFENRLLKNKAPNPEDKAESRPCRHLIFHLFCAMREKQDNGLTHLSARHLRTLLLWECNRHGDWSCDVAGERFLGMLQRLKENLKLNTLQDFFYIDLNTLCDLSVPVRRTMHFRVKDITGYIAREPESVLHFMPY